MTHANSAGTTREPSAIGDPRQPVAPEVGEPRQRRADAGSIGGPGLPADDAPRERPGEPEPDTGPGTDDPDVQEELAIDEASAAAADRPVVDVERE